MRVNIRKRDQGYITEKGVKRIARMRDISQITNTSIQSTQMPQRHILQPSGWIVVVLHAKAGQLDAADARAIVTAQALAQKLDGHTENQYAVAALVFGELKEHIQGVDRLIFAAYDITQYYQPQVKVASIVDVIEIYQPKFVLFQESDWGDSDILRRVAVTQKLPVITQVIELSIDRAMRYADNGRAYHEYDISKNPITLLGLKGDVSTGELEFECVFDELEQPIQQPKNTMATFRLDAEKIALNEAPLILSIGNGVSDISVALACAEALQASVGASRVVVDDGKIERNRQVGATGTYVNATVYLAFGISGAIQHLQGIAQCKCVVAINTDESCAMVQRADYAIIGDANEIMQAICEIVAQQKVVNQ